MFLLPGRQVWGLILIQVGFPAGASGKELSCQCRTCKRLRFDLWVGKIPWRRAWQPTLVFLPGESCRQTSLVSYGPWGCKELDTTEVTEHTLIEASGVWGPGMLLNLQARSSPHHKELTESKLSTALR